MDFGRPELLMLLAAPPLAAGLLWAAARWRTAARASFASPALLARLAPAPSLVRGRLKAGLLLAALALLALGAARPHLGQPEPVVARAGSDILIALDVSLSMAATDAAPSRLDHAKAEILSLLDHLEGDRVGLVVFAGSAVVRFPMTTDLDAARTLIRSIEIDSAPVPGSSLAAAVKTAIELGRVASAEQPRKRVLVLISDGEDLGGELAAATALAVQDQTPIYTIAVGTAAGSTIPTKDRTGKAVLKTDPSGAVVRTRMDESTVRALAQATGGRHYTGTAGLAETDRIYAEIVRRGQTAVVTDAGVTRPQEAFQFFGLLAFLALAVEWLITDRKAVRV